MLYHTMFNGRQFTMDDLEQTFDVFSNSFHCFSICGVGIEFLTDCILSLSFYYSAIGIYKIIFKVVTL